MDLSREGRCSRYLDGGPLAPHEPVTLKTESVSLYMTKHVRYVNLKLHCKVQHKKLLPVRQLEESTVYFTSTVLQLVINFTLFSSSPLLLANNTGLHFGKCYLNFSSHPDEQDTPPLVGF